VIKNRTLIERLQGVEEDRRSARFVSAVTLVDAGRVVFEAEETCEGRIAHEPRGFGGFGYDPVFYFPPLGKTLAEASNEEKDAVSHRGKSTAALREFLIENASENTKSSKAIEPC
jgi:XTP/dITP diphosphohydrolase